jgi:hypothetical protein
MFAAIGVVWHSGVKGTINFWLCAGTGALVLEVAAVTLFRGYYPIIYFHRRYGDDKRLLELFMLWRYAKYVFTTPFLVTMAGYVLVLVNMGWRRRAPGNCRGFHGWES